MVGRTIKKAYPEVRFVLWQVTFRFNFGPLRFILVLRFVLRIIEGGMLLQIRDYFIYMIAIIKKYSICREKDLRMIINSISLMTTKR